LGREEGEAAVDGILRARIQSVYQSRKLGFYIRIVPGQVAHEKLGHWTMEIKKGKKNKMNLLSPP